MRVSERGSVGNEYTQTSNTNFRRVSRFNTILVKRAHKPRTCWSRRPFRLIYRYQIEEKYKIDNNSKRIIIIKSYVNA